MYGVICRLSHSTGALEDTDVSTRSSTKSRDKFVELAQKRMVKAIKSIRLVGNLSNKSNYSYSATDAQKIVKALEEEVRNLKKRFESGSTSGDVEFTL